jgi:hypothetical protein
MTNLQDFILKTMDGKQPSNLNTQNSIFPTIKSLAKLVVEYHSDRQRKNGSYILRQRKEIGSFARKFSAKALALTKSDNAVLSRIESKINSLSQKDPDDIILLMSAHQPNLFPYSGVTRKIALMVALREEIKEITRASKEVVCFYGIADHDFIHNKWIRSAELPAPMRKEGTLRYSVKIPQKDVMLPANKISKPSIETIDSWKSQTRNWLHENATMAQKYVRLHYLSPTSNSMDLESIVRGNEEDFWRLVYAAYSVSETLGEFNSILLYLIAVEIFEEPILFANFSDCFTIFGDEYSWMLDNAKLFSEIITSSEAKLKSSGIDSGLAEDIGEVFPVWLKCSCGSKYRLAEQSKAIFGKCQRCGSEISYSIQELKELTQKDPELFEPRSITMPIAFAKSTDMSCYIGGIGGLGYLLHTREISDQFQSPLPPTPFWYVDDIYISLELLCSALQVKRLAKLYSVALPKQIGMDSGKIDNAASIIISVIESEMSKGALPRNPETQRDKQLLYNIKTSVKSKGCMLDYAINIGLKSNFEQWIQFLRNDGRMQVPVKLESQFEA